MVSANERLWTDDEFTGMNATLLQLRRMRTAAVMEEPSLLLRMRKGLDSLFGGQEEMHNLQEALAHAEYLGDAAGDFFAAKLSKTAKGTAEFERWQDILHDQGKQYKIYTSTAYSKVSVDDNLRMSIIGRLRKLHIDPVYMLKYELAENNNLGADSVKRIVNQDIGVISPLSGDYLLACVYSAYLRRTRTKTFPVRAAALSKDLSRMFLPQDKEGNLPFGEKSAIGIYIDTTATGDTARSLATMLKEAYPHKTIHQPRTSPSEFTQSEKMKKYWERQPKLTFTK